MNENGAALLTLVLFCALTYMAWKSGEEYDLKQDEWKALYERSTVAVEKSAENTAKVLEKAMAA